MQGARLTAHGVRWKVLRMRKAECGMRKIRKGAGRKAHGIGPSENGDGTENKVQSIIF